MNLKSLYNLRNFWGKLLGGIFGFLIGGPVGALFGILIGNVFDRGLSEHFNTPFIDVRTQHHTIFFEQFIKTTFSVMGYLAKTGGHVSEEAIVYAEQIMRELKLNKIQVMLAKQCFSLGKSAHYNLTQDLINFRKISSNKPEFISTFLNIQYQGLPEMGITSARYQALDDVFQTLGFAPLNMQNQSYQSSTFDYSSHRTRHEAPPRHTQYSMNSLAQAYAILNVDSNSSKQTVKQAYRRLISKHHPDKLIASKCSEREIKEANEKTQRIRKAYEMICEDHGWS